MKQVILLCAIVIAMAFPMSAQDADRGDAGGIRATISGQFSALEAEDFARAFTYASPAIQRLFQTADGFEAMVKTGYPMVYQHGKVRFLELRVLDGVPWQKLLIRDRAGVFHVLDYRMVQVDGAWRIDGVQFLRKAEVGA